MQSTFPCAAYFKVYLAQLRDFSTCFVLCLAAMAAYPIAVRIWLQLGNLAQQMGRNVSL